VTEAPPRQGHGALNEKNGETGVRAELRHRRPVGDVIGRQQDRAPGSTFNSHWSSGQTWLRVSNLHHDNWGEPCCCHARREFVESDFDPNCVGEYPVRGFNDPIELLRITAECRSIVSGPGTPRGRGTRQTALSVMSWVSCSVVQSAIEPSNPSRNGLARERLALIKITKGGAQNRAMRMAMETTAHGSKVVVRDGVYETTAPEYTALAYGRSEPRLTSFALRTHDLGLTICSGLKGAMTASAVA